MREYRAPNATASYELCPLQVSGEDEEAGNWGTLNFERLPQHLEHPIDLNAPPTEEEVSDPRERANWGRVGEIAYLTQIQHESWQRHMLSSLDFSLYTAGWLAEQKQAATEIKQVFKVPSSFHQDSPVEQVLISFAPSGSARASDVSSGVREDFPHGNNTLLAYPQDAAFPAKDEKEFEEAVLNFAKHNLGFGDNTVEDIQVWRELLQNDIDAMRPAPVEHMMSSSASGSPPERDHEDHEDHDDYGDDGDRPQEQMYFEKQRPGSGHCGMHALNNVFGREQLRLDNMQQACQEVVRKMQEGELGVSGERVADHCFANGWYSGEAMREAAALSGEFHLGEALDADAVAREISAGRPRIFGDDVLGLVVWVRSATGAQHWVAVKAVSTSIGRTGTTTMIDLWLLDSLAGGPRLLTRGDYEMLRNSMVFPVLRYGE